MKNKIQGSKSGRMRNALQVLRDREFIAELYLKGNSVRECHRILNENRSYRIGVRQMQREFEEIRKDCQATHSETFEQKLALELAKIGAMEREAWAAWEASKGTEREITRKITEDSDGKMIVTEIRRNFLFGHVKYLKVLQWCSEQRCKILGLYATESNPKKFESTNLGAAIFENGEDGKRRMVEFPRPAA